MQLGRTPLGDLVPGHFTVPQNPILMNTAQKNPALAAGPLGDLVNGSFPVPQNPILAATSLDRPKQLVDQPRNALVRSLTAAKTGPVSSDVGMGDAASTLQSVGQVLDNTYDIGGNAVPYWVLALGAIGVIWYLTGGKKGPNRYQRFREAH